MTTDLTPQEGVLAAEGPDQDPQDSQDSAGLRRRTFMGWVLAGTTLTVAADLVAPPRARAAGPLETIPSGPQVADVYDLEDAQTDAALPTAQLITITVNEDGDAVFELPRTEVGQGILTSTAMIIAEELDLPVERVKVSMAKARPELVFNQLTGGSNTTFSTYTPVRVAAAIARQQLIEAAAIVLNQNADRLVTVGGVVRDTAGNEVTFGDLAVDAASQVVEAVEVVLRPPQDFTVIGTPQSRLDALAAVTGAKKFTADLAVPNALPTMVCRPPTHRGKPIRLKNPRRIKAMPGVTHVKKIPTGIAVRARTFGQCIDAIRAMSVEWAPGAAAAESDESILEELRAAELPLATPDLSELPELPDLPEGLPLPVPGADLTTIETDCVFAFKSSAALEPYTAIADVRGDRAEVWAGLKAPILAQQRVAEIAGLRDDQVTVHVIDGGGSFGHKLFGDHADEAAHASKAMGVPVKLMWHRADEPRQGRMHPMATSRVRATLAGSRVVAFEQRHTSVLTDFSHGLGERLLSVSDELPPQLGNYTLSQSIFATTQQLPYNFGLLDQLMNETLTPEDGIDERFSTGSMRNIYSPDVCTAAELTIDKIAAELGEDPVAFRIRHLKDERVIAALEKVAEEGRWGRRMPAGTAQGVAIHKEYKGCTAVLVEIDNTARTRNRNLGPETVTGPRVTKVVVAVDVGLCINPRGLEAQMQGGAMDGIALTLTSSAHLERGRFLEASWDNYFYTRQWNTPFTTEVHIMPSDSDTPGGAGEAATGSTAAAVACAYARATRTDPSYFPINHNDRLKFTPKPFIPSVPQSPTNGLSRTY